MTKSRQVQVLVREGSADFSQGWSFGIGGEMDLTTGRLGGAKKKKVIGVIEYS